MNKHGEWGAWVAYGVLIIPVAVLGDVLMSRGIDYLATSPALSFGAVVYLHIVNKILWLSCAFAGLGMIEHGVANKRIEHNA